MTTPRRSMPLGTLCLVDMMKRKHLLLRAICAAILVGAGISSATAQQEPLFTYHSNAWLNLHHYVRAAARGAPTATGLTEDEAKEWAAGVELYKPYASRDVLRDDRMLAIASALRGAEDKNSLDGIAIDAALKATLERLMPIYRSHWWPQHDRANREWIATIVPLVDRHGAAISQALLRTYGATWPAEPMHVDLSVVAGPVGAFSANGHITISSSDPDYRGHAGLEMLFHEASHGLELSPVLIQPLDRAAAEQNVTVPPQLWHAVIFYTAGELTRRELRAHGISYTLYGGVELYENLCGAGCRDKLAEHWAPHLDGTRSIPDAIPGLAAAFK